MCGIVGYLGPQPAYPILIDGLKRLEYRGYDSAGVATLEEGQGLRIEKKQGKVAKLSKAEVLMLNIGSMCTGARVVAVKSDLAKLQLTSPVCTKEGEKVALSRRVEKHWRLIGWGQIQAGVTLD